MLRYDGIDLYIEKVYRKKVRVSGCSFVDRKRKKG